MKKVLSLLLIFALLIGALSAFPVVFASDTPYSGGSGTEDDPYLISTEEDIKELCDNIENDPSLYGTKVYYKLMNDLTVNHNMSPLYVSDFLGPNALIRTQYSIRNTFDVDYENSSANNVIEIGDGPRFNDVVGEIGPLTVLADDTHYAWSGTCLRDISSVCVHAVLCDTYDYYKNTRFGGFESHGSYLDGYYYSCHSYFYCTAAFTGVFDGNGHTLSIGSAGYLFGIVENGAEIKNLNVQGSVGSLAWSIDESCTVKSCTFDIAAPSKTTYMSRHYYDYLILGDPNWEDRIYKKVYDTVEAFVPVSKGSFIDCINYGSCSIDPKYANAYNFVDLSERKIAGDGEEFYTREEYLTGAGDMSAFEGFDFESTWVMKNSLPVLRSSLETGTGDMNFDGVSNGIDGNLLKRYVAGKPVSIEFVHPDVCDMNRDGALNAMDSALLKRMMVE